MQGQLLCNGRWVSLHEVWISKIPAWFCRGESHNFSCGRTTDMSNAFSAEVTGAELLHVQTASSVSSAALWIETLKNNIGKCSLLPNHVK